MESGRAKRSAPDGVHADLAGALHEVSNALTVVLGWLDTAQSRAGSEVARDAIALTNQAVAGELGSRRSERRAEPSVAPLMLIHEISNRVVVRVRG